MSLGRRLINTGAEAACLTETTDIFGDSSGVALYSLDYDASDAGGLYDGSPTDVDFGVGGQINYGARFNGSSSRIQISSTSTDPVNISTGTFSISMWINMDNLTNNNKLVYKWGTTAANRNFAFTVLSSSGYLYFVEGTTGGDVLRTGTFALSINTWHHIALTREQGGSLKMYVDGDLKDTFTATGTFKTSTEPIYLGYQVGQTTNFDGRIDQVRIFSKELSSSEVSTLYAETACVHTATTTDNDFPTTNVAYYKLDNSAEDEKGSYDGTESNIEYRFGRFGQAAVFSANGYISGLPTVENTSNEFSISLWFNTTVNPSVQHTMLGGIKEQGTNDSVVAFKMLNDGYSKFYLRGTDGTLHILADTVDATDGNWHHLVGTVSNSSGVFYVDGQQVDSATISNNITVDNLLIGAENNRGTLSPVNYFNGSIDQVRIFSTALTSDQVSQLYNEKPETDTSNFKTVLYEGNGSTQYISNVGFDLDADNGGDGGLVWIKARSSAIGNVLIDSVRGASKLLQSETTSAETTYAGVTSFDANGFTVNGSGIVGTNANTVDYVAWVWKGGGDAVSNTDGTITSQVSANTNAGFSIVKYTGNGSVATVGHGLDNPPEMIIIKNLDNTVAARNWAIYHNGVDANPENYFLRFNTESKLDYPIWNDTAPDSDVFTLGDTSQVGEVNDNNNEHIAYCFHSVSGYSKIGSYSGDGSSDVSVTTGFRPRWVMIKRTDVASQSNPDGGGIAYSNWFIWDSTRDNTNPSTLYLMPNESNAEGSNLELDFDDNGFTVGGLTTGGYWAATNASGGTYIYMAFK